MLFPKTLLAALMLSLFVPVAASAAEPGVELFVSPKGNDAWSGRLAYPGQNDGPFATVARAQQAVRALLAIHKKPVRVVLRGGTYCLDKTLEFGPEDSGTEEAPVVYVAAAGEKAVFSGAAPVRGWTKLPSPPPGLPQAAQGKVWVADVSWVRELKQRQSRSPSVATQSDRGWGFLTLYQGDRFSWHGRTGWGIQHDWEMFDSPSALVRFRGAEGCAVEHCRFVHAGGSGVRFDLHAQNNRIRDNEFAELGGAGIVLAGYGPGTKDVNRRNEVANNHVHHIGQLYWGSPAIIAWQSGENHIVHNTVHHAPYDGICVVGRQVWDPRGNGECARTIRWHEVGQLPPKLREQFLQPERLLTATDVEGPWSWRDRERFLHARNNLIEHNDIHHVMQTLGDGNCIYLSAAGGGNRVRENYCHDCDGREMNAAMRCDGDQHGTMFERNIVFRTGGFAEGIISKGDNDILGNILADLRPTNPRHRGYLVFPMGSPKGSVIQHNVFFSCRKGQIVCDSPKLRQTDADYNLYSSTADPHWGQRHLDQQRPFGIEAHSVAGDPLFVDLEHRDFRFRPESPALKLGIQQPFDVRQAGVQRGDRGGE